MSLFPKFNIRSHPSNPANWLLYGLSGGQRSYTGKTVTEESSLTATAMWSAVTQLSADMGALGLDLYKRLEAGKKKAVNHPKYDLLHLMPNPEMDTMAYREAQTGSIMLWGNGYSEISYDESGKIIALWPLLSSKMTTKRVKGQLIYVYQLPDGQTALFPRYRILHISGFSIDGIMGMNPITKTSEAIGLSLALEEYAARFFGQGAKPPVVLTHPETLSKKAKTDIADSWQEINGGLDNAHRVAVLEEGMQLKEFGVSPDDAQAIEARKFQINEVARITNMPVHRLKDLEKSSFNNIEHQDLEYVKYTLLPWTRRKELAYTTQLLTPKERKNYFYEYNLDTLLRGDTKSRAEYNRTMFNMGYPLNRILERENENPVDWGDEGYLPINMIPASLSGDFYSNKGSDEPQQNSVREKRSIQGRDIAKRQFMPIFKSAAQRIVNKEKNAITKKINTRSKADMKKWVDNFYDRMPDYIRKELGPAFTAYAERVYELSADEIGAELSQEELDQFIQDYTNVYVERHIDSSKGQLYDLIDEDGDIEQRVDEWGETRADKIAENETSREGNAVYTGVAFSAGMAIYWRIRGAKTCPYCTSLNGKRIKKDQTFVNNGDTIKPKNKPVFNVRGTKKHPPLHLKCDCMASIF